LPGLRALIASAGLGTVRIDGYDVGFKLAPRLNAAGRMGHARLAVELLTRADDNRAREIALYLEDHNRARQAKERKITQEVFRRIEQQRLDTDALPRDRIGRSGLARGRDRPRGRTGGRTAAQADDHHRRGERHRQGSGRSIARLHLYEALRACREHLSEFGGHAMAAGLKIEPTACRPLRRRSSLMPIRP